MITIELTEAQYRELLTLMMHYSTRHDHWAISSELKLAVIEAAKEKK